MAVTKEEAWNLANHWVAAWNAHDLDLIMSHYEDGVELTSPIAAQLLGTPDGRVMGKAALREYFQLGLEAYPDLSFRLKDVLWCVNSVVLYYTNQKGTRRLSLWNSAQAGKWHESWRITARASRDTRSGSCFSSNRGVIKPRTRSFASSG